MDKLEPILKHHFWILLVPLLSMNLWGYFSANKALKDATSSRQTALDSAKSSVPAGTTDANDQYAGELGKINDKLEVYVKEELDQLWVRQQPRMIWPETVAAKIPATFRAEIPQLVRFSYQTIYQNEVIKPLHQSVEPMVLNLKEINYVPKVDFPRHLIPQMRTGDYTITSQQMWDAQEDVWVTQLILDAIRQMNKDADSTSSAVIRRVIAYRLLGGDGTPVAGGGATGGGGGGESGMSMSSMMDSGEGSSGLAPPGGGGGAGGAAGKIQTSVRFNPSEEFGIGGEASANTGMTGGTMLSSMAEGEGGTVDAAGPAEVLRYVKDDPNLAYMERGFYLSVIINQEKLVDFLVALSNSDWPVKVVRFQFGRNPWKTDEFKSAASPGGANMAMMGLPGAGSGIGLGAMEGSTESSYPSGGGAPYDVATGGLPGMGFTGGGTGGAGANTGYKVTDLDHPDLIQLDLCGLVTLFRQPAPPEGEAAPAEGAPASEEKPSEEKPADATATAPTSEAAPAAAEPGAAPPAGESTEGAPAATPATGTESPAAATEPPAGTAPAEGATPVEPPAEGTPADPPAAPTNP